MQDPCRTTEDINTIAALVPTIMSATAYAQYGGPEVLEPFMVPTPKIADGQVLLKVHAAGVNPIDYRIRRGDIKWLLLGHFPRIPGYDVSGVVVQEQSNGRFAIGDRVFAFLDNMYGGGYAEYAACGSDCMAKMPASMSFEEAAAIPLAGTTALQCLRDHGSISSGDSVLINGASGGVGAFAIQIAKSYGTEVTAVASGSNEDFVRSMGADAFIDHEQENFAKSDKSWNLILDAAGKSSFLEAYHVLAPGGRFVSTEPSLSGFLVSVATVVANKQSSVMLAKPNAGDLEELARLYSNGALKVTISDTFRFDDAWKAHQQIESGKVGRGKLVLAI